MEEKELYRQRMNALKQEYKSIKSTMLLKFFIFLFFLIGIIFLEVCVGNKIININDKTNEFILGNILMALLISCVITILASTDAYAQNTRSMKAKIFDLYLLMKSKGYLNMFDEKYLEEKRIIRKNRDEKIISDVEELVLKKKKMRTLKMQKEVLISIEFPVIIAIYSYSDNKDTSLLTTFLVMMGLIILVIRMNTKINNMEDSLESLNKDLNN